MKPPYFHAGSGGGAGDSSTGACCAPTVEVNALFDATASLIWANKGALVVNTNVKQMAKRETHFFGIIFLPKEILAWISRNTSGLCLSGSPRTVKRSVNHAYVSWLRRIRRLRQL